MLGVQHVRCGEPLPTLEIWNWITQKWDKFTLRSRENRPFRTAAEAQFWYEWRLKGRIFPILVAIAVFVFAVGALESWYVSRDHPRELYQGVQVVGGLLTALAVAAGFALGVPFNTKAVGQRELQFDDLVENMHDETMGNFLSSRPIANSDLANAILRTAAHSSLFAWSIWFTVCLIFLLLTWCLSQFPESVLPPKMGAWYFPLTILGPWIAIANIAVVGLSGRASKITFTFVGLTLVCCITMGVLKTWFSPALLNDMSSVTLSTGSLLVVVVSLWAFATAFRKKFLSVKGLVAVTVTCLGIATAAIMLRPGNLWIVAYPMIFAFAALVVLPFASTPLAIAWNRHR